VKGPILIETRRHIYVIARDFNAGKRNRYTTHQIERFGLCNARVIGRELPLSHSRRVVAGAIKDYDAAARDASKERP
jgi:hypothetical protein